MLWPIRWMRSNPVSAQICSTRVARLVAASRTSLVSGL